MRGVQFTAARCTMSLDTRPDFCFHSSRSVILQINDKGRLIRVDIAFRPGQSVQSTILEFLSAHQLPLFLERDLFEKASRLRRDAPELVSQGPEEPSGPGGDAGNGREGKDVVTQFLELQLPGGNLKKALDNVQLEFRKLTAAKLNEIATGPISENQEVYNHPELRSLHRAQRRSFQGLVGSLHALRNDSTLDESSIRFLVDEALADPLNGAVQNLVSMGFSADRVKVALNIVENNTDAALSLLLDNPEKIEQGLSDEAAGRMKKAGSGSMVQRLSGWLGKAVTLENEREIKVTRVNLGRGVRPGEFEFRFVGRTIEEELNHLASGSTAGTTAFVSRLRAMVFIIPSKNVQRYASGAISNRSFFRACNKAPELFFEHVQDQLWAADVETAQPGDVLVTKHSNIPGFEVAYHLVVGEPEISPGDRKAVGSLAAGPSRGRGSPGEPESGTGSGLTPAIKRAIGVIAQESFQLNVKEIILPIFLIPEGLAQEYDPLHVEALFRALRVGLVDAMHDDPAFSAWNWHLAGGGDVLITVTFLLGRTKGNSLERDIHEKFAQVFRL